MPEVEKTKRFKIFVSKLQKNELVEDYLLLKEINPQNLAIHLAIKKFYKKYRPAEFETHKKLGNWASAKIHGTYLRKWTGLYLKEKNEELEKLERGNLKTEDEIKQEKMIKKKIENELEEKKLQEKKLSEKKALEKEVHEKELMEFKEKPMIIFDITPHEKQQIIFRFRLKIIKRA